MAKKKKKVVNSAIEIRKKILKKEKEREQKSPEVTNGVL